MPVTNARWPMKDSKDAGFRLVIWKEKTSKLPLEFFSQPLMTLSKAPWPHTVVTYDDVIPKSSSPKLATAIYRNWKTSRFFRGFD